MTAKKPVPDPAQAEAEDPDYVTVPFNGEEYRVARSVADLPFDYVIAVDDGRYGHACRYLLGDEYQRFLATAPTAADAFKFMRAHEVALGLRSGE
jgi:hypothetical protein